MEELRGRRVWQEALLSSVWLCQKVNLTWKQVINRNLTTGNHTSISAMKTLISEKENRTQSGFHVSGGSLLLRPFPLNHLMTILELLRPVALVLLRRMAVCRWSPGSPHESGLPTALYRGLPDLLVPPGLCAHPSWAARSAHKARARPTAALTPVSPGRLSARLRPPIRLSPQACHSSPENSFLVAVEPAGAQSACRAGGWGQGGWLCTGVPPPFLSAFKALLGRWLCGVSVPSASGRPEWWTLGGVCLTTWERTPVL